MEHAAEAGEILVSEATAAALEPQLLGEERGGGRLLKRSPAPPAFTADDVQADALAGIDLEGYIPEAVRFHLRTAAGEAEHRPVTIGFVKFSGVDRVVREEGLGEAAARLDRHLLAAHDA